MHTLGPLQSPMHKRNSEIEVLIVKIGNKGDESENDTFKRQKWMTKLLLLSLLLLFRNPISVFELIRCFEINDSQNNKQQLTWRFCFLSY